MYMWHMLLLGHVYIHTSERSEQDTISGVLIRAGAVCVYIYVVTCAIISKCHVYVMWVELGHYHFLYVPAVL